MPSVVGSSSWVMPQVMTREVCVYATTLQPSVISRPSWSQASLTTQPSPLTAGCGVSGASASTGWATSASISAVRDGRTSSGPSCAQPATAKALDMIGIRGIRTSFPARFIPSIRPNLNRADDIRSDAFAALCLRRTGQRRELCAISIRRNVKLFTSAVGQPRGKSGRPAGCHHS